MRYAALYNAQVNILAHAAHQDSICMSCCFNCCCVYCTPAQPAMVCMACAVDLQTEKLLLYGGAIHEAGEVKARANSRSATSDWMALEKQRGISISSTAMTWQYNGKHGIAAACMAVQPPPDSMATQQYAW